MLFVLNTCVNKKAPPTHSVHWGLNPPPSPPTFKNINLSVLPSPLLNLQTIQSPLFRQFSSLTVLQSVAVFSVFEETKFEVDTASIILSYLYHFVNLNKKLMRCC